MCVLDLLLRCGPRVRDALFSGTSGWSPQLGGVLTNGTCEAGAANGNGRLTRCAARGRRGQRRADPPRRGGAAAAKGRKHGLAPGLIALRPCPLIQRR
jgi:hypothetical protein